MARTLGDVKTTRGYYPEGRYELTFDEIEGRKGADRTPKPRNYDELMFRTTIVGGRYDKKRYTFFRMLTPASEIMITNMLKAAGLGDEVPLPDEGDYSIEGWLAATQLLIGRTVPAEIRVEDYTPAGGEVSKRNEVRFSPPRATATNGAAATAPGEEAASHDDEEIEEEAVAG
jgi:hypothetical protein